MFFYGVRAVFYGVLFGSRRSARRTFFYGVGVVFLRQVDHAFFYGVTPQKNAPGRRRKNTLLP
jgi:hypothetical protein